MLFQIKKDLIKISTGLLRFAQANYTIIIIISLYAEARFTTLSKIWDVF